MDQYSRPSDRIVIRSLAYVFDVLTMPPNSTTSLSNRNNDETKSIIIIEDTISMRKLLTNIPFQSARRHRTPSIDRHKRAPSLRANHLRRHLDAMLNARPQQPRYRVTAQRVDRSAVGQELQRFAHGVYVGHRVIDATARVHQGNNGL